MKKQDIAKKMIHGHETVNAHHFSKDFLDSLHPDKKKSHAASSRISAKHNGGNEHNMKRDALIRERLQKGR